MKGNGMSTDTVDRFAVLSNLSTIVCRLRAAQAMIAWSVALLIGPTPLAAQDKSNQDLDKDLFPRIVVGAYFGYYNSFMEDFEKDNSKEPMFGANFALELFKITRSHAIYAVGQYSTFLAKSRGKLLTRWRQNYTNYGLRYVFMHDFFGRPTAMLWIGTGVARIHLRQTDVRTFERIVRDEHNNTTRVLVDKSTRIDRSSNDFYIEVGQYIPLPANLFPKFGFLWNFKYDRGNGGDLHFGSLSAVFGFYFSGLY